MWDLPRPRIEPVSPALAGRFSTTVPPGKPYSEPFLRVALSRVPRHLDNRAKRWLQEPPGDVPGLCDTKSYIKQLSQRWIFQKVQGRKWSLNRNDLITHILLDQVGWSGKTFLAGKNQTTRASLVAQWLRICPPVQGTRVRALVREDPTCRGATGPVSHNYWACASGAGAPQQERPRQWEARAPRWRVAPARHN